MIIVDTGVLLAVADADDRWHLASTELLANYPSDQLILPAPVIPETGWMIAAALGPATEAAFIASVAAAVIAVAERLNVTSLATINPTDFPVVRPVHCDAFELVPRADRRGNGRPTAQPAARLAHPMNHRRLLLSPLWFLTALIYVVAGGTAWAAAHTSPDPVTPKFRQSRSRRRSAATRAGSPGVCGRAPNVRHGWRR